MRSIVAQRASSLGRRRSKKLKTNRRRLVGGRAAVATGVRVRVLGDRAQCAPFPRCSAGGRGRDSVPWLGCADGRHLAELATL